MKQNTHPYSQYDLVREMCDTPRVIRELKPETIGLVMPPRDSVMLSGEGSSRLFPAKRLIADALRHNYRQKFVTQGGEQAAEINLEDWLVFAASNSGKTAEVVRLVQMLAAGAHGATVALTTDPESPLAMSARQHYTLSSGKEKALAATKTVVEQALYYDILFRRLNGRGPLDMGALANGIEACLSAEVPQEVLNPLRKAPVLYFAGRDDGVAEEITLKANEIAKRKSDYLEGTYAVHGVEEVMRPDEAVVLINPFPHQEEKFAKVLRDGVGIAVVAIASRPTIFPTFIIPEGCECAPYLQLAAGWNLLVELGIGDGLDLDTAERARKVGNAYEGNAYRG